MKRGFKINILVQHALNFRFLYVGFYSTVITLQLAKVPYP